METSSSSTGKRSSRSTSSVGVTLANLSVRLADGVVKKIRATCGRGYETPLARYDPATPCWRMFEGISRLEGPLSLASLPPSGMTRSGVLFPRPPWEPITDETDSSSWPTPTANDAKNASLPPSQRNRGSIVGAVMRATWPTPTTQEVEHPDATWKVTQGGRVYRMSKDGTREVRKMGLADAVQHWPTPTAVVRPMEGNVRLYRAKIEAGEMTEEEAEAILGKSVREPQGKLGPWWPTPTASDSWSDGLKSSQVKPGSRHSLTLGKDVQLWPTMSANGMGNTGSQQIIQRQVEAGKVTEDEKRAMTAGNGGRLNPTWVEWLMGFPLGWTDLKASGTPSSPKSPKSSGA